MKANDDAVSGSHGQTGRIERKRKAADVHLRDGTCIPVDDVFAKDGAPYLVLVRDDWDEPDWIHHSMVKRVKGLPERQVR